MRSTRASAKAQTTKINGDSKKEVEHSTPTDLTTTTPKRSFNKVTVKVPSISAVLRRAQTPISLPEDAPSATDTPTKNSSGRKRKRRDPSPAISDTSLPDLKDLLSTNPETQSFIDEMAKKKFNYKLNKKAIPDHAIQTEQLLSREDIQLLSTVKDKDAREKFEQKLIRQQAAAFKTKLMWIGGEIEKLAELELRVWTGDDSEHDSWSSRKGALWQLCGEIRGWKARQGGHSD